MVLLTCRRCICDVAVGIAWYTSRTNENMRRRQLEPSQSFTAGMSAKLNLSQLRRHVGGKDWDEHWCCRPLLFSYRNSIPSSTGGHVAGASAAYENQALFSCGLHLSCRTGNCRKQDRYNVCSNINYCYTVRYLSFSDNPKCKVLVVEQLRAMVAYENQTTRGLFQE